MSNWNVYADRHSWLGKETDDLSVEYGLREGRNPNNPRLLILQSKDKNQNRKGPMVYRYEEQPNVI